MAVGIYSVVLVVVVPAVVLVDRMRMQVGCIQVLVVSLHFVAYVKVSLFAVPIARDIVVLVLMNFHLNVQV